MAQPVEVHVRAADDGNQVVIDHFRRREILLHAGHGECAGRFGDGAGVVEDVLDRAADLVDRYDDDRVDILAGDLERLLADLRH